MPLRKIGEISVPSDQKHLEKIDRLSGKLLGNVSLRIGDLDDVAIAISEAANNAMQHGNRLDTKKNVKIRFYICSNYLRIIVQDEGPGFSPEKVPDPREEENLLKASGRGLLIIRHLMDHITFKRFNSGMQIIMDKYRS